MSSDLLSCHILRYLLLIQKSLCTRSVSASTFSISLVSPLFSLVASIRLTLLKRSCLRQSWSRGLIPLPPSNTLPSDGQSKKLHTKLHIHTTLSHGSNSNSSNQKTPQNRFYTVSLIPTFVSMPQLAMMLIMS